MEMLNQESLFPDEINEIPDFSTYLFLERIEQLSKGIHYGMKDQDVNATTCSKNIFFSVWKHTEL